MPLVAHSPLPSFQRLASEGENVIAIDVAEHQGIRELHIGLLNMMPDAALEATERQFFRLIGECNQIAQFYLHPFSLDSIERGAQGRAHIEQYYESFDAIREQGLDALIITGANVSQPNLADEAFWQPLSEVIDWANENVTSVLCSCLATHAVLQARYQQKRIHQGDKIWGVYPHQVTDRTHPLVNDINTRFDVPHSRYNDVSRSLFEAAGLQVLAESEVGVHLAVSEDGFRTVFFQGHPEYDTVSLLKEYKREIMRYLDKQRDDYPPFPDNYLDIQQKAILDEFRQALDNDRASLKDFPEAKLTRHLNNTWRDTAKAVVNNWLGKVYATTSMDRKKAFMDHIDTNDPLGLGRGPGSTKR